MQVHDLDPRHDSLLRPDAPAPGTGDGAAAPALPGAGGTAPAGTVVTRLEPGRLPVRAHPALADLARIPLDQPVGQVLHEVAAVAVRVLPGVDALSVTSVQEGQARSAAVTHPLAALLDERQYEEGFGPCMDTARSGGAVRVDVADGVAGPWSPAPDGAAAYPGFSALARRHGVRSVVAVALSRGEEVFGALTLYSRADEPLGEECVALAVTFAGYAGAALAHASLLRSSTQLADQMRLAMSSRAVIEQAKGVLVAVLGLPPEEAFVELSRRSQCTNTKLRDVAARVVAEAQQVHQR